MNDYPATPEQIKSVEKLIEAEVEYLDEDAPTPESLIAHLQNSVLEFTPVGDWTDPLYAVILSR